MEQYLFLPMVRFLGKMKKNWLYFLRHFQNAGLANSITFFMSDRDKGLINSVRKVFPDIPHSKCLRHLSENFKKSMANKMQIFYNKLQDGLNHNQLLCQKCGKPGLLFAHYVTPKDILDNLCKKKCRAINGIKI